ncbi:BON domain-containing protein [Burkholderia sp. AW49-1]
MQRRYPGRQAERSGPPDWHERGERAYRGPGGGTDERDFRGDEFGRQDADYESPYRHFASEDVGPEDWGSEWSERSARSPAEQHGRDADWRAAPGSARDPAWEAAHGYGNRGRRAEGGTGRESAHGDRPGFGGHPRMSGYGGERDYDARDPRRADAPDLSRFGSDAQRDAMRRRRGPKGYTRSDERIREDVCERLAHALDIDVSDVSVQVRDGRVELDGTVPSRWMKHDIEDIADSCMCVRDIENRVRVQRNDDERDTGMVLHPSQRTVTPTQPAVRDPEPGSDTGREPRH